MLKPLRGSMLASVDIIFLSPPSTRYLLSWVANTKPRSHKPAVCSCMHSSCRAICRFCHKSCVGSKGFGALGELGNFCASKHKFTYSGTKHCSVTKIFLPSMASCLTNIKWFSSAPQRCCSVGVFSLKIPSNLGVCTTSILSFVTFPMLLIFWKMCVVRYKSSGSKAFHFSLTWKQEPEGLTHLCCFYNCG